MVFISPINNIKGFIVSKPPLVLFTLCLIAFGVTTFTFAYIVEHKDDLRNVDAHRDWLAFLKYLDKRKLCISSTETSTLGTVLNETETRITVSVMAKLQWNTVLQNITHVQGFVATPDWASECPGAAGVPGVSLTFAVSPHSGHVSNLSSLCVDVTGPAHLLPPPATHCTTHTNTPPPLQTDTSAQHVVWGHILNSSPSDADTTCPERNDILLTYTPSSHNERFLTVHDRSIINLHLFHTSYFLLVLAITLVGYAVIRGKPLPVTKHQALDKQPIVDA